jgi:hypothetical protein
MAVEYCGGAANLKLSERHGLRLSSQRESTVGGTQVALIAALAATTQAVFAQHGDFAPKVQVIIDYLKNAGDECVSPALPGERPFKACREGSHPVSLTIATRIPVRDSNGRVIDTCPAKLTAVQLPGLLSVRFDVAAVECPESTLKSGEFTAIFAGLILELAEWVQTKEKPI